MKAKLKETKEEAEQIRRDCQAMIRQYQESEEMKSASLDSELKKKEKELKHHEQELLDQQEVFQIKMKELETLKESHKELFREATQLREKAKEFEEKTTGLETVVMEMKRDAEKAGKQYGDLKEKYEDLLLVKDRLET